jgi:hypothetical protein
LVEINRVTKIHGSDGSEDTLSTPITAPSLIDWKVDYGCFSLGQAVAKGSNERLLAELTRQWKLSYEKNTVRVTDLFIITHKTFSYLYDDYATLELTGKAPPDASHEARVVAAYGISAPQRMDRDNFRLNGWVGRTETLFGSQWDKGHFIAHSIGGAVDKCELNVFVQNRKLNRGWSAQGKLYRQMEKFCFRNPGAFCFSRPLYSDGSAKPRWLEYGILKPDGTLWIEIFDNFEATI